MPTWSCQCTGNARGYRGRLIRKAFLNDRHTRRARGVMSQADAGWMAETPCEHLPGIRPRRTPEAALSTPLMFVRLLPEVRWVHRRRPLSNPMEGSCSSSMASVSLAFNPRRQTACARVFDFPNRVCLGHVCPRRPRRQNVYEKTFGYCWPTLPGRASSPLLACHRPAESDRRLPACGEEL
jgi:hypothetical protein